MGVIFILLVPAVYSASVQTLVAKGVIFQSQTKGTNATVGSDFYCDQITVDNAQLKVTFENAFYQFRSVPAGLTFNKIDNDIIVPLDVSGNFTIYFSVSYAWDIPIGVLNLLVFLIILLIPTLAFYYYMGRVAVIPSIMLMTVVGYIGGLIPLNFLVLIFIICIAVLFAGWRRAT